MLIQDSLTQNLPFHFARPNSICLNNLAPTDINSVIQQIEEEGRALDQKELGVVVAKEKSTADLNSNNNNNINNSAAKTKTRLR